MRVQCPTCLEVFTPEDDLQCPPCGHVFHGACIRQWLRSKQGSHTGPDCPQCRKPTDLKSLMKIYLAEADGGDSLEERVKTLQRQIEEIHNKLEIKEWENIELSDRLEVFERAKERKMQERKKAKCKRRRQNKRERMKEFKRQLKERGILYQADQ